MSIGVVVPDIAPFKPSDVRIADIDGDGRADLCFVHDNGDIGCSRNGGLDINHYWQGFSTGDGLRGLVFTGKNKGNKNRVRLGKSIVSSFLRFHLVVCHECIN